VRERDPRDLDPAGRGGDPDHGKTARPADAGRALPHGAAGRLRRRDPVRRHDAGANLRERGRHRADLEPVLRRRPGKIGTHPLFFRVTLPFLAGYFVSYVYRSVNAIIGPELAREFGLSAGGLGLLTGIYFFAFAAFQLPLGLLLDRYGPRRVNATLLLVAAAGGLWFSLAPSAEQLTAARALIGLGVSGCLMSSLTAFALWYPAERMATMNGIAFASGMLGALTATVPLELLLRVLHWREVFYGIVALTLAVSLTLFLFVPERSGAKHGDTLAEQVRGFAAIARDPAFWRAALCIGASQMAAVSLGTLWVATWLRDVEGWNQARVARGLFAFGVAMIFCYLGFGRAADAFNKRGRSTLPLLAGGVVLASLCLALLALGVRSGAVVLWSIFFGSSTAVVLMYALLGRRYPKQMAGRVNTALNVFVFIGMFSGQWAVGIVLNQWPQTPDGYAPEAYPWALGTLWTIQFAGLVWLWSGRRYFRA
jgi:predicted MFS family arabinose efflux permease